MATEDDEDRLLRELEELVNNAANEVLNDFHGVLQEPAFSAHLAEAIKIAVRRHPINARDRKIEVIAADMHNLGSTMEKETGADFYISVVRLDRPTPVSKGMLVQSKWDHTVKDPRLPGQIEQMASKTDASYIWVYGPNGVFCAKASTTRPVPRAVDLNPIGELIANGLRCTAGDLSIGRDLNLPTADGLITKMRELHVGVGVSATLTRNRRRR